MTRVPQIRHGCVMAWEDTPAKVKTVNAILIHALEAACPILLDNQSEVFSPIATFSF